MKLVLLVSMVLFPCLSDAMPVNSITLERTGRPMKKTTADVVTTPEHIAVNEENKLERDTFNLDEIVVTGQGGAIQRRRLSSKISKVGAAELQKMPSARIDQMLQNALPNVQINLTSGQAGTTSMFKSRGMSSAFTNSTPVIYIDGVRADNMNTGSTLSASSGSISFPYSGSTLPMGYAAASGTLSDIPMENIDHIEYLTGGAATTLYGSDAANGVILIYTKKGGSGRFNASFTSQFGIDNATSQFYHFNRTKDLLNQNGFLQRYKIAFNGGNERIGYSLGASMSRNTGIIIHNGNEDKKYDLRFGSHMKISKLMEYQNSFGLAVGNFRRSRNGNQGLYTGLWTTECSAAADLTYIAEDGSKRNFNPDIDAASDFEYMKLKNLVSRAEELQDNKEDIKRFQTAHTLLFTPLRNLTLKATMGLDYRTSDTKEIITNEYLVLTQVKPEGTADAGWILNNSRDYFGITMDANGEYKYYNDRGMSNIFTGGFQFFSTRDHQSAYNGGNVRDGAMVMSGAGTVTADEWLSYLYNYGFYAQNNFGYRDRYYLDLGMRVDYNTAFGDNVGWQFYPKFGLSYVISEENFMRPLAERNIINSLRIMANYGVAGSYPPAFAYQKTINISAYKGKQAATFGKYGNPNLGPEKKHSFEIGFDGAMLKNILNVGFTYYYTRTKDAIFSIPTLPSSGQSSTYLANVGDIENNGVEITIGVTPVSTKDWTVSFRSSFNTNRNKVLSTGGQPAFAIGGFGTSTIQNVVEEGKPVGFLRGNKAVLNADGTLKEVVPLQDLGTTLPTFYGNMSLNVRFKEWQLYVTGDYQTGSYVHSFDRHFRFKKGIPDAEVPPAALSGITQGESWLYFTNYFVDKADFFKIRNIGIDYTIKFNRFALKRLNVALNVYNPFAFTASSVDPEATLPGAFSQGAVATGGLNYATYSSPRQYVMSLKFDF
jgi:TonB-dependent SusC/RagA subfamily outer membrane receptor